jgi:hypothetical protein
MKALLTACVAIACAASQVTWLDGPPSDPVAVRGDTGAQPLSRGSSGSR